MTRVGVEIVARKALPFRAISDGETVSGRFTGTVQLSSGEFATLEKAHDFSIVPWRPVLEGQIGREVTGVVQRKAVSWQLGQQRGLGL